MGPCGHPDLFRGGHPDLKQVRMAAWAYFKSGSTPDVRRCEMSCASGPGRVRPARAVACRVGVRGDMSHDRRGKATQNRRVLPPRRQEKAQQKARGYGQLEEGVELQPVNELQPVRAALMSVNLGQYADEFGALGYDVLPDLQTSSEVERAEIAKEVRFLPATGGTAAAGGAAAAGR